MNHYRNKYSLSSILFNCFLSFILSLFSSKGWTDTLSPLKCPNLSEILTSTIAEGGQRRFERNLWLVQGSDFISQHKLWHLTLLVNALNEKEAIANARIAIFSLLTNYTQEMSPSSPHDIICKYRSKTMDIPIYISTCTFDNDGECN